MKTNFTPAVPVVTMGEPLAGYNALDSFTDVQPYGCPSYDSWGHVASFALKAIEVSAIATVRFVPVFGVDYKLTKVGEAIELLVTSKRMANVERSFSELLIRRHAVWVDSKKSEALTRMFIYDKPAPEAKVRVNMSVSSGFPAFRI